jgi:hypothetical protein
MKRNRITASFLLIMLVLLTTTKSSNAEENKDTEKSSNQKYETIREFGLSYASPDRKDAPKYAGFSLNYGVKVAGRLIPNINSTIHYDLDGDKSFGAIYPAIDAVIYDGDDFNFYMSMGSGLKFQKNLLYNYAIYGVKANYKQISLYLNVSNMNDNIQYYSVNLAYRLNR